MKNSCIEMVCQAVNLIKQEINLMKRKLTTIRFDNYLTKEEIIFITIHSSNKAGMIAILISIVFADKIFLGKKKIDIK